MRCLITRLSISLRHRVVMTEKLSPTRAPAAKVVIELSLGWQGRISFKLTNYFSIKRIKFFDDIRSQNDDIESEDAALRFDADFVLMTGELNNLISDLIDALGGEAQSRDIS